MPLAQEAGADAIHVSAGSAFPHPDNPAGGFHPRDVLRTYDTMLSSGSHTFRNYLLFRVWPFSRIVEKRWATPSTASRGGTFPTRGR